MKLNFGNSIILSNGSVKNIEGFYRYNRFIVLSEITSDTIPNILDLLFNFTSGDIDMIPSDSKKTKITVINNSEVYGSYHGLKDTRTRSVYIHHGVADCNVDRINGDTPIKFTDMDYNVIADKPSDKEHGPSWKAIGEVNLSYDQDTFGNVLYRDTDTYKQILTPSPEFYDEKDMVLLSGREEDYSSTLLDNKENIYFENKDKYEKNLYTLTLNQLIDDHTKVMKLNMKIDNLSSRKAMIQSADTIEEFNAMINDVCCQIKYSLEKSGFSSAEIILNGSNGYNITNLRSYLDLNQIEKRVNYSCLCGNIDDINNSLFEGSQSQDFSYLIRVNYSDIKVVIVDFVPEYNDGINKTDLDTNELGQSLRSNNAESVGFPYDYRDPNRSYKILSKVS